MKVFNHIKRAITTIQKICNYNIVNTYIRDLFNVNLYEISIDYPLNVRFVSMFPLCLLT